MARVLHVAFTLARVRASLQQPDFHFRIGQGKLPDWRVLSQLSPIHENTGKSTTVLLRHSSKKLGLMGQTGQKFDLEIPSFSRFIEPTKSLRMQKELVSCPESSCRPTLLR